LLDERASSEILAMSPKDEQRKPSVLSELPSGRPQLRSERRGSAATPKPPAAAKPKPKAAPKPKPKAAAKPKPAPKEPIAPPPKQDEQPFVATALQAAGELAQIGIAVGARALRNALDRLPKP
jgi:outer membrane biosynthesis protein TonB